MQTSSLPRENGAHFPPRRAHYAKLSISDDSHHVTEAIGDMYDEPTDGMSNRTSNGSLIVPNSASTVAAAITRAPASSSSPSSPSSFNSDTALSPFPLNNIDYESSPAAVAKELSNLQALRRMSMNADLGAADDPDLPQFNASAVPASPSHSEDDSSRLFWVPARLHPELAPKEFKTFLDSRVEQIKRRSGELAHFSSPSSSLSVSSSSTSPSSPTSPDSGLRRKKSMLSRQIHSPVGYRDGAEILEKKKSASSSTLGSPDLEQLESLVSGTGQLSVNASASANESESGLDDSDDIILPSVPSASLKRSKRTNYRRGGSLQNRTERGTYAQRAARKAAARAGEEPATSPSSPSPEASPSLSSTLPTFSTDVSNLASTLSFSPSSDAIGVGKKEALNFSRPASVRSTSGASTEAPASSVPSSVATTFDAILASTPTAAERRSESVSSSKKPSLPQMVHVTPPEEPASSVQPPIRHPERSSSRDAKIVPPPQRHGSAPVSGPGPGPGPGPGSPGPRSASMRMNQTVQSLEQPSLLPGNNSGTQELTFIPTLTVDKRADQKVKKDESKKSGWSWLLGKEEDKERNEKLKHKLGKPSPSSDNTRLDVLQTSIDGQRSGRESLVLDRESIKLEEERKKESVRKSASSETSKKEKDGFLSTIFGGGKKGKEKDHHTTSSRKSHRLSPEPTVHYRELKPDIDYNWTRFTILEERAIYRMAHIKLANPRRSLYSQVLLSNFMYSYLAKVQQMHPQMNLPTSAKQQRSQQQQLQQQQQQQQLQQQQAANVPDGYAEYQRYQDQQSQADGQHGHDGSAQHSQYAPQQVFHQTNHGGTYGGGNGGYEAAHSNAHANANSNQDYEEDDAGFGTGQTYYHQQQQYQQQYQHPHHQHQHQHQQYQQQYQQQYHQQHQHRPYNGLDDDGDDDDEDMW